MRRGLCVLLLVWLCMGQAWAVELPGELLDSVPPSAAEIGAAEGWEQGSRNLAALIQDSFLQLLRKGLKGVVSLLLVVVLCGLAETMLAGVKGREGFSCLDLAAAAAVAMVAGGDFTHLMGLGQRTVLELDQFSKVLLPTIAAATASMGMVGSAAVRQMATMFFCDILLTAIDRLVLPLIQLYIAALCAGSMLRDGRLDAAAEAIKKVVTWTLSGIVMVFTLYLSIAGAVSGTADGAAAKVVKKAIAAAVPVVGNIVSGAADTVMAGAGVLKNTIGVFGVLVVLAACVLPFLQIAVQYLLYKAAALVAGTVGSRNVVKLIDGLGGAFGLLLGAVGSCALLLLISLISSLMVVIP